MTANPAWYGKPKVRVKFSGWIAEQSSDFRLPDAVRMILAYVSYLKDDGGPPEIPTPQEKND